MDKEAVYISCIAEASFIALTRTLHKFLGIIWWWLLDTVFLILRTLGFVFMTSENIKMKTFIFNLRTSPKPYLFICCSYRIWTGFWCYSSEYFRYPKMGWLLLFAYNISRIIFVGQLGPIVTVYLSYEHSWAIIIPIVFLDKIFPRKSSQKTSSV